MKQLLPLCAAAIVAVVAGSAAADGQYATSLTFTDGAIETPLTDKPGDPANGRAVLGKRSLGNCVACHAVSDMTDVPWHGEVGPALDGAGSRWTVAQLRGIVVDAKRMFDGTIMPSFHKVGPFTRPGDGYTGKAAKEIAPILDAQQIEDVVAYLATLKE